MKRVISKIKKKSLLRKKKGFKTVGELVAVDLEKKKHRSIFVLGTGKDAGTIRFEWQGMSTIVHESLPLDQLLDHLRCTQEDLLA